MSHCDRCGGTNGNIYREAHVDLLDCVIALQRQAHQASGIIAGLREERDDARDLVRRFSEARTEGSREDIIREAAYAVECWLEEAQAGGAK